MLNIEVDFLTGRYVASRHDDRDAPEWPPHPARLFSALVAEWAAPPEPDPDERSVLEFLERQEAPQLSVTPAVPRATVIHYVPVNDTTVVGAGLWSRVRKAEEALAVLATPGLSERARTKAERDLTAAREVTALVSGRVPAEDANTWPEKRGKQARTFPSVTLEPSSGKRPTVTYVWPGVVLDHAEYETLDGLLRRVTRLGHSSSLVSCRLRSDVGPEPTHWPSDSSDQRLRVTSAGQLEALVSEHTRHEGSRPRSLPAAVTGYTTCSPLHETAIAPCAGEWFAFEISPRLGAYALANVTGTLREKLEASAGADAAAAHEVFVLGLPSVGQPHASGDLLGAAILLPNGMEAAARRATLRAIAIAFGKPIELPLAGSPRVLSRVAEPRLLTLRRERWSGQSSHAVRTWITATPAVISTAPPRKLSPEAYDEWTQRWLAESCARTGLPRPDSVTVSARPFLNGARVTRGYPPVAQADRVRRIVHARIEFPEPVLGPVLIGAKRHLGFGLLCPAECSHV